MNVPALTTVFDQSLSMQITWLMLHFLWHGLLIALVVFVTNLIVPRNSPKLRYAIAVVGMFAMIAGVATTWLLLQPANVANADIVAIVDDLAPQSFAALARAPLALETINVPQSRFAFWAPIATAIYVVGVGVMLLRLLLSALGIGRLRFTSKTANHQLLSRMNLLSSQLGLSVKPALKTCERVVIPFVAGLLKPAILLPSFMATGLTPAEVDAILLHELAHIRRGDILINFLQRIVESLLFFHPGVWYVSRIITFERENCCDDIVLGHCTQKDYASSLIRLAELCLGNTTETAPLAALAATGASPSQLKRRVMRILGVQPTRRFNKPGLGVLLVCVFTVAITAAYLPAQTQTVPSNVASLGHPLTISLDADGNVVSFTLASSGDGAMQRFTSLLQKLSKEKGVRIESSTISNKGKRKTMTVVGKNLDYAMIKDAVKKIAPPRTVDLKSDKRMEGFARRTANFKIFKVKDSDDSSQFALTEELRNQKLAQRIASEFERVYLDATGLPSFLGPVRIETKGNGIIIRGEKQDVERVKAIIKAIEDLSGAEQNKTRLNSTEAGNQQEEKGNSKRLDVVRKAIEMAYGTKNPAKNEIRNIREKELLHLRIELEEFVQKHGKYHPRRKSLERQIQIYNDAITEEFDETSKRIQSKELPKKPGKDSTGNVRFEIFGDGNYAIRGKKPDVDRVQRAIKKDLARSGALQPKLDPAANGTTSKSGFVWDKEKDLPPLITGPVRLEFLEDTDIFVVRGKKEDVDNVMQILGGKRLPKSAKPSKTKAETDTQKKTRKGKTGANSAGLHHEAAIKVPKAKSTFVAIALKNAIAEQAAQAIKQIYHDLRPANNDGPNEQFRIQADVKTNRILIYASEEMQKEIVKILKDIDQRPAEDVRIMVYSMQTINATKAQELVSSLFADEDKVRIKVDERSNTIIISAPQKRHVGIRRFLEEIDRLPDGAANERE